MRAAIEADPEPPAPPLAGDINADVCIVGGGYTGLWTAIELKRADPKLDVVVLEAMVCGWGASGRNGGFALSWWYEIDHYVEHLGAKQAVFLGDASSDAIDRIETLTAEHEIDVGFHRGGLVWAASSDAQRGTGSAALAAVRRLGRDDRLRPIADAGRRIGSPVLRGGVSEPSCGSVQPGLLVRGLRRIALREGVRLFEHSPVVHIDRAGRVVHTSDGVVRSGKLVLALNAWAARLPELRGAILPVTSLVVLTPPIPDRIARIGWTGGEVVADGRTMVHYTHVTRDGRIAFGRGGGPAGGGGRVTTATSWHAPTARAVAADFRRFFPSLADVPLESAWGGAVDRSCSHRPFFTPIDDAGRVLVGAGYSGNGVAPSAVGGRILASLALERRDEWATCGLVGLPERVFPPEPFRSLGAHAVRRAIARKEAREDAGQAVDPITRGLAALVSLSVPRRLGRA